MSGRLRVAVLLPGGDSIPEWAWLALNELLSVPDSEVSAIVVRSQSGAWRQDLLARAFDAIDRRLFPPPRPARRLVHVDRVSATDVQHAHDTAAAWELVSQLHASTPLDVVIDMVEPSVRPRGPRGIRFGVWAVLHDGTSAESAAREAVLDRRPSIRSVLARVGEEPVVVYESVTGTDHVSATRTADRLYWKIVPFGVRALRHVLRTPPAGPQAHLRWSRAARESSMAWLATLPTHVTRYVSLRLSLKRRPHVWTLLVGRGDGMHSIRDLHRLHPTPGTFWADPFIVERDGQTFVFFEELPYATGRGHISVITLDGSGRPSPPRIVLQRPYHLSYPFLFEFDGQLFLLPETGANRTIDLYRCDSFPDQWTLHATLMSDVHAVDSTLLQHDGRWWLFTNIAAFSGSSSYDELCLFHAPAPDSTTWTPHPLNPVISHAGFARPAGPIVRRDGVLIRPSQDCAGSYGRAVRLNRIDRLTDTEYHESPLATIEPNWDPDIVATHTISTLGDLVVLDGKVRQPSAPSSQPHQPHAVYPVPFSQLGKAL